MFTTVTISVNVTPGPHLTVVPISSDMGNVQQGQTGHAVFGLSVTDGSQMSGITYEVPSGVSLSFEVNSDFSYDGSMIPGNALLKVHVAYAVPGDAPVGAQGFVVGIHSPS